MEQHTSSCCSHNHANFENHCDAGFELSSDNSVKLPHQSRPRPRLQIRLNMTMSRSLPRVPRRSKNELLAARLGLTSTQLGGLVTQPREVVAALAEAGRFSEAELNILRDIRRRGKNLIAAHSCRNRKLAEIEVDVVSNTVF